MTLQEFKAWLDGFSDAMGDAPTAHQWAKIKAKLATVQGAVIAEQFKMPAIGSTFPNFVSPYTTC